MHRLSQLIVLNCTVAVLVAITHAMATTAPASAGPGSGATDGTSGIAVAGVPRHNGIDRGQEALSLTATSPPVPAGATVPVVVTLSNSGGAPLSGTIVASVPDGWQALPGSTEVEHLDQGEDQLAVFEVTVPDDADPANYPVSFLATTSHGTTTATAPVPVDPVPVTVTAVSEVGTEFGHHMEHLADGYLSTKWFTNEPSGWAQLRLAEPVVVTEYSLTSAEDFHDRDPSSWTLSGSNDGGETWTVLDTRTGEVFPERHRTNTYRFENRVAYRDYRLDITENNGGPALQLAEFSLNTLPTATSSPTGGQYP